MRSLSGTLLFVSGFFLFSASGQPHWPQFRGPLATGVSPDATPPLEWSEENNLRWKAELPGLGHSSPIVWGDQIFVTTAIPFGDPLEEPRYSGRPGAHNNLPVKGAHAFVVFALDRHSGQPTWQRTVKKRVPHEGGHETGSLASATPATDGERVYAFFGSHGLYCLDAESGEPIWELDFGDQHSKHGHGEGSSPVLSDGILVVNWDHEDGSFLVALDAETGKERWRVDRDEKTSWASPIVVEENDTKQLIVSGTKAIRGYDLTTGKVLWKASGLSDNVVASPVAEPGYVYAASSYNFQAMLAIRLEGAAGDLDGTDHIVWKRSRRTPYVPSPLLYDGVLYFLAHYQGVLSRVEGKTGNEPTGPFRLLGLREIYASPVAADGRIYLVDRSGVTVVMSHGEQPKPLAVNSLDDRFSATPALVEETIYLRGERFLYAIGQD